MAKLFQFVPFKVEDHFYSNEAFAKLCDDAVLAFNATPVCDFPPPMIKGAGVYAIYCTATKGIYEKFGNSVNRLEYRRPIYVGSAVPPGWRKSRTAGKNLKTNSLQSRLMTHSESIRQGSGLDIEDFACRFMIFDDNTVNMITAVESALIAHYTPLWNTCIDGFGNHTPGAKRKDGKLTKWDTLHHGRGWTKKMSGEPSNIKEIKKSVMDYMMGLK